MKFEPIHRIVFNVQPSVCINELMGIINKRGYRAKMIYSRAAVQSDSSRHVLPFITKDTMGRIEIENPQEPLVAGTLQDILDEYTEMRETASIDYIHGDNTFVELSKQYSSIGFKLPPIEKEELFPFVYRFGILPKKCFSMGEAEEKRYYMECRLLIIPEEEKKEEPAEEPVNEEEAMIEATEDTPEADAAEQETAEAAPAKAQPKAKPVVKETAPAVKKTEHVKEVKPVKEAEEEALDDLDDLDDLEDLEEHQILHLEDEEAPVKQKKSLLRLRSKTHI